MKITRIEPKELASPPLVCGCPAEDIDQAAAARWLSDQFLDSFIAEASSLEPLLDPRAAGYDAMALRCGSCKGQGCAQCGSTGFA